ncbi:hypothetical protein U1Q18_025834 [Sarracenia purpurea var. burkii]
MDISNISMIVVETDVAICATLTAASSPRQPWQSDDLDVMALLIGEEIENCGTVELDDVGRISFSYADDGR